MTEIQPDFGHWFSGFVDGEGCFMVAREYHKANKKIWYKPVFGISLRDDDADILHRIYRTLGFGKVYIYRNYARNDKSNRHGHARYQCAGVKACLQLLNVFEQFPLRAKKLRDYEIWREYVRESAELGSAMPESKNVYFYLRMKEVKQYSPSAKDRLLPIFSSYKKWEKGDSLGLVL